MKYLTLWRSRAAGLWDRFHKKLFSLSVMAAMMLSGSVTAFASTGGGKDIWQWLEGALQDVYGKILGITTIGFCLAMSVALMYFYFSKDERQVASARTWIKQIIAAFIIINVLGYVVAYLVTLTDGGRYTV